MCSSFSVLGTEERYRRAVGQRWEEQRAQWRVSQRPLLPQLIALGLLSARLPPQLPPPPPSRALPRLPTPQPAVSALRATRLLLLLLLLQVLATAVVVVLIQPVRLLVLLLLPLLVLEDWQCLRFPFTAACLIARQYRWDNVTQCQLAVATRHVEGNIHELFWNDFFTFMLHEFSSLFMSHTCTGVPAGTTQTAKHSSPVPAADVCSSAAAFDAANCSPPAASQLKHRSAPEPGCRTAGEHNK